MVLQLAAVERKSSKQKARSGRLLSIVARNRSMRCVGILLVMFFAYVQIIFLLIAVIARSPVLNTLPSGDDESVLCDTISRRRAVETRWADLNSTEICSPEVFKKYYAARNYFSGEGQWVPPNGPGPSEQSYTRVSSASTPNKAISESWKLDRFIPEICKFRYGGKSNPLPPNLVSRCFRQKNIYSVATMGDSNGAHHFDAIVRLLNNSESGNRCQKIASELVDHTLLIPDVAYYTRHDRQLSKLLRATHRHCSSCVSRAYKCQLITDHRKEARRLEKAHRKSSKWLRKVVELEHLSMVSVLDSSVKIDVPHNHFAVNLQYRADTYQEFLLKYYLRNRYPDLLIIFPPFNHDKKSETVDSLAIRLRYFIDLLELYLPPSTRVIWVPSFTEFESRKPPVWANRRMHGMLGTEKIDKFNHALYHLISSQLQRGSDYGEAMAFFDQVRVSATREDMSVDGVHMNGEWYAEMTSYIMQMFCSDVIVETGGE